MENKQFRILLFMCGFIALVTMMNTCNSCSTKREIVKVKSDVDSLKQTTVSSDEFNLVLKEEGYKISKRMLYDNNTIVRTTVRPDDKMNEYDKEIEKLQKEIQKLKKK